MESSKPGPEIVYDLDIAVVVNQIIKMFFLTQFEIKCLVTNTQSCNYYSTSIFSYEKVLT